MLAMPGGKPLLLAPDEAFYLINHRPGVGTVCTYRIDFLSGFGVNRVSIALLNVCSPGGLTRSKQKGRY